jgi:hypothetical protein
MNGHIDQMTGGHRPGVPIGTAVRIGWINEQIMALRGANIEVIDLGNRTVIQDSTIRRCIPLEAASTTTWNYAGTARRDAAHAEGASVAHSAGMGASRRRLDRVPVRRATHADAGNFSKWSTVRLSAYVLRSSCPTKSPSGIVWLRSTAYWTTRFRRLPHGSNERADPYCSHSAR